MGLLGCSKIKPQVPFESLFESGRFGWQKKPFGNLSGSSFSLSFPFLSCSALSLRRDKSLIDNGNSHPLYLSLQFLVFHMHYPSSSCPDRDI